MNQRSLIAIIILAGIGSIGSVLAYTGTITANQGSFNNVLVTGTCTGCGNTEADYTTYSLVINKTITGTVGWNGNHINLSNDKSLIGVDQGKYVYVINSAGTIQFATQNSEMEQGKILGDGISGSSSNGKYKVATFNNGTLSIFKNDVLLQHLTITAFVSNGGAIAISPNGQYVAFQGDDSTGAIDRIQIWQGS